MVNNAELLGKPNKRVLEIYTETNLTVWLDLKGRDEL